MPTNLTLFPDLGAINSYPETIGNFIKNVKKTDVGFAVTVLATI